MPNWKKVIVSGSNASLNSLFIANAVTASIFSGSHIGPLTGTASWATNTLTASYVNTLNQNVNITGSVSATGNLTISNITLANPGTGSNSQINFAKTNDSAVINVNEYASDQTMFEFKMTDNPDSTTDIFHWVIGDWQSAQSGWKPLKFAGMQSQLVAQNTNFYSTFAIPVTTSFYTTNPDTINYPSTKYDPYTSTTYNIPKDQGSGTGTMNVDATAYTGTATTIYVIEIEAGGTTFKWGNNILSFPSSSIAITGNFQSLNKGIQIKLSTTGQVAGDRYSFRAFPVPRLVLGKSTAGNSILDILGNGTITGSLNVTQGITGSLFGTSSWTQNSISSSFASTASNGFPFTGSAIITGSLIVTGSINATDDIVAYSTSDARFKSNISPISDPLYKLNQIRGVEFNWLENPEYHGFKGYDVGVIAQEIEKVLPEIVTTKDNGYKAVKYEKIIPLLIEAIKAQQSQINDLKEIIKNK